MPNCSNKRIRFITLPSSSSSSSFSYSSYVLQLLLLTSSITSAALFNETQPNTDILITTTTTLSIPVTSSTTSSSSITNTPTPSSLPNPIPNNYTQQAAISSQQPTLSSYNNNTTTDNKHIKNNENKEKVEGAAADSIHMYHLQFDYVRNPVIISVFILVAGLLKILFHHANFLSSWLPESCLLIILGIVAGAIIHFTNQEQFNLQLTPKLFMLFLLPPIVLDSAYSLHDRVFYQNLGSVLVYAILGTIINWITIGPCLYGLARVGAMGSIEISFVECLLFSSFIVAVDPVAVLSIFQEIGVNKCLYFLVFGESLLNDAVTIVLANTMTTFVTLPEITPRDIGLGIGSFFTVTLGGIIIGLFYGSLTAFITKHTQSVRVVEPLCMFAIAYLSFISCELFHWSGIIGCVSCGLMQGSYAMDNLSNKSRTTVKYFIKMLSSTMDSVIFLFLGLELIVSSHHWHTGFVLWTILLCLIFRAFSVIGLTFMLNYFRERKINYHEQFIMFYGGLRGVVCFALASTLTEGTTKKIFMTTTFAVIIFTVFFQGISTKPFVNICKIRKLQDDNDITIIQELSSNMFDNIVAGIEGITDHMGNGLLLLYAKHYDDTYIRPFLQTKHLENRSKLIEIFDKSTLKLSRSGLLHFSGSTASLQELGYENHENSSLDNIYNLNNGFGRRSSSVSCCSIDREQPQQQQIQAPQQQQIPDIKVKLPDKDRQKKHHNKNKKTPTPSVTGLRFLLKKQSVDQVYPDANLTRESDLENHVKNIKSANFQISNYIKKQRLKRKAHKQQCLKHSSSKTNNNLLHNQLLNSTSNPQLQTVEEHVAEIDTDQIYFTAKPRMTTTMIVNEEALTMKGKSKCIKYNKSNFDEARRKSIDGASCMRNSRFIIGDDDHDNNDHMHHYHRDSRKSEKKGKINEALKEEEEEDDNNKADDNCQTKVIFSNDYDDDDDDITKEENTQL